MNKTEFVTKVAAEMNSTKKAANEAIESVFTVITNALLSGDEVKIGGFGAFKTTEVAERTGTIQLGSKKGEKYVTPAHKKAVFKPSSTLKNAIK